MLCPFADRVACCCVLLGVVKQSLKPVKLLALFKRMQHCWPAPPNIFVSCCVCLHLALGVNCGVSGELCTLRHNESYRGSDSHPNFSEESFWHKTHCLS